MNNILLIISSVMIEALLKIIVELVLERVLQIIVGISLLVDQIIIK